ncbi:anti-adapter protein IraP [Erwiniaceae bacterium L1_54_6]|jgi:ribosomal protein L12E/L44/L45/RPP1/RPP2|uniref:Anti-adapter protein IraP n=1 Tax=Pantoea cypripedii TaxID=55209 RepID=A0A6B9FWK1_PANCY|nr:anti-adapter protein IraP [Pantoea cypripedii]MDF7660599.1 anti-adapter protein IraP [Erwiniaceae bacterium L1_54_6]QGY28192.1 anti-adapter protein IraP [Pantoea cypripedii]
MKNLIAELLLKLAEKEEESKELVVQVEALEIVVTALLRKLEPEQLNDITSGIDVAMSTVAHQEVSSDAILLRNYVEKLLNHPRI